MILRYLTERRSWILFFLLLQLFIVAVAYFDAAIPLQPILYIVFLSWIAFLMFVIMRYNRETRFYRGLEAWERNLDLTSMPRAESPYERIVENSVTTQTEWLKQQSSRNQTSLEQEKDELLSWIHEVKTPLTAMRLMIDRLDNGPMRTQLTYEWLRIHLLLDQQLHHKRISSIENDLYMEQLNIQSLLVSEIKDLQSWCMSKGIGIELELEAENVLSDAKWLAYIVRQILTNAVKYSEASDIVIRSYWRDEQFALEVEDSGRGIDPRDLPRIFDRGFTSTAQHHDHASTGMGLYLAKQAAETLGIRIDVRSQLGAGTTFTLTFPKGNAFHRIAGM
jgi:two-component system, OmpR family, bacitracin resistance sensor histidine kinase BceS